MGPREIQRGQVLDGIPASSWNAFVQATRKINALTGRGNGQASSDRGSIVHIQVRNDTLATVPAFGVLLLDDAIFSPADRAGVIFDGILTGGSAGDASGRDLFYAVMLEPVESGKIGWGVISGATWARINVNNEAHEFVEHGTSTDNLETKPFRGRPILWKEEGTGEKWAIIGFEKYGVDMALAVELIDAMGTDASTEEGVMGNMGGVGTVNFQFGLVPVTFDCINCTGRPIWNGSRCYMHGRGLIIGTDAADLISGDWDGSGSKTDIESYTLAAAGLGNFDATGVVNARFSIVDPLNLLTDVTAGSPGVLFSTGGIDSSPFNKLYVISTETGGTGGGAGGDPWTGWPGPDPTTGIAPGKLFKALVNSVGGVASGVGVPFDNTTAVFGTAPADGTATNPGFAFSDNEIIYVAGNNSGTYYAIKQSINIIKAQVDSTNHVNEGNGTFSFNNGSALLGQGPGTGTATNPHSEWFSDNEWLTLFQNSSNQWVPLERQISALFEITTQVGAASWNSTSHELTEGSGAGKRLKLKDGSTSVHDQYAALTYTLKHGGEGTIAIGRVVKADWTNGRWLIDVNYCRS